MKILFTICGRAGSKGIHNKNIKTFCEFPLPLYSLSALDLYLTKHPECDADIALNTDSLDLKEIFFDKNNAYLERIGLNFLRKNFEFDSY